MRFRILFAIEGFWESGLEWRWFDNPLHIVHYDQSLLSPIFSVSAGYRRDNRFKRAGDDLGQYSDPSARYFFRFQISTKVVDQRQEGEARKTFTFRFGVDHERPVSEKFVPAATKFSITSDIDLLNIFKAGKDRPETPPPPSEKSPAPDTEDPH